MTKPMSYLAGKAGIAAVALTVALAGCTQNNARLGAADPAPAPLPASPTASVDSGPLEPTQPTPPDLPPADAPGTVDPLPEPSADVAVNDLPDTPRQDGGIQTPDLASTASQAAQPVSREALIGAWTVASGGTTCQIFLALTRWQGGFRAAQRGCTGSAISGVQSWDVKSNRVVLNDGSGTQVASLAKTGEEAFSGTTNGGGGISFSR